MFSFFSQKQAVEHFTTPCCGRTVNTVMRRRHNAKRITMRIKDGDLHLTAPPRVSGHEARRFIAKHEHWIEQNLRQWDAQVFAQKTAPPAIFYHGEKLPVIWLACPNHRGKSRVTAQENLTIHTPNDSRLQPWSVLEAWLKQQARENIAESLAEVLPQMNEPPAPFTIRDQKTRWGSCSTSRRLSFNWRLIMAPPLALHYVVVHEAAHLIHHDHSPRFWAKVAEIMPDYKQHQRWLKTQGKELFIPLEKRLMMLKASTDSEKNQ